MLISCILCPRAFFLFASCPPCPTHSPHILHISLVQVIEELKQSYAESQAEEQVDFESRINSLADEVSSFANYTELKRLEKASAHAQQVKVRLAQADEDAKMFNSREALFEKDITSYAQINKMKKQYVTR